MGRIPILDEFRLILEPSGRNKTDWRRGTGGGPQRGQRVPVQHCVLSSVQTACSLFCSNPIGPLRLLSLPIPTPSFFFFWHTWKRTVKGSRNVAKPGFHPSLTIFRTRNCQLTALLELPGGAAWVQLCWPYRRFAVVLEGLRNIQCCFYRTPALQFCSSL